MRISDWSSDVCSSDLGNHSPRPAPRRSRSAGACRDQCIESLRVQLTRCGDSGASYPKCTFSLWPAINPVQIARRSEEHTSELQSLMRISYAVFCLKKKKKINTINNNKLH